MGCGGTISKRESRDVGKTHTHRDTLLCSVNRRRNQSVQSQGEGWWQRIQSPVLEEKLINSLKPILAWNRKTYVYSFSEVYIC